MRKLFVIVMCLGLVVIGCGKDLSDDSDPINSVDSGGGSDVDAGAGPLPFNPKADPIIPGQEQVFSVARARCQIVIDRFLGTEEAVGRQVWTYDDIGNMSLAEYDDGADGTVDRRVARTFDGPDQLVREEDDRDGDGIPDTRVLVSYEDDGRVISLHDSDADGMAERRRERLYAGDLLTEESWYEVGDEIRQSRVTYTYDAEGRPTSNERFEGDSVEPAVRTTWSYDGRGRLLELGQDLGADGQIENRVSYRYDESARSREGDTLDEIGTLRGRVTDTYDGENRLIERLVDIGGDGQVEQTTRYTYEGVLLMAVSDTEGDAGGVETRFAYDRFGYLDRASVVRSAVTEVRDFTHHCRSLPAESER